MKRSSIYRNEFPQAMFFDFDGVLVDSAEIKTDAFYQIYEKYGREIANKVIFQQRNNRGVPRGKSFEIYHKKFLNIELSRKDLLHLCDSFSKIVVESVIEAPEISGATKFLQKWSGKMPCYIVSASPLDELAEIVKKRNLNKYFKCITGSPDTKKVNLNNLLKKSFFDPTKCLFWGDALADWEAAKSFSMPFVGIVSNQMEHPLKQKKNLIWVNTFLDVANSGLGEFYEI
ncbi:MAG: HAD family phosphatase [Bacteroidetes bacterium]|nr:HAD family phosphatase [Bacteroidota bacterium]